MDGAAAVHLRIPELDVTAYGVRDHRSYRSIYSLSKKSGVCVAGASRCIAHHTRAHGAVFHWATVCNIRAEDLGDAALGSIWHPVFSMTNLVEFDVLELGVGGHCWEILF